MNDYRTPNACNFPGCGEPRDHGVMCATHQNVTVLGSWVPDRHTTGEAS